VDERPAVSGPAGDAERWLAGARADDAARHRGRVSSLVRQGAEEATLAGVLTAIAERDDLAVVHLRHARTVQGRIRWVGADAVLVHTTTGRLVLVATDAIAVVAVAARGGSPAAAPVRVGASRHELLVGIAGDGVRLQVPMGPGGSTAGELDHVGTDVIALRRDDRSMAYLALDALEEITLLDDPWGLTAADR
jgi:hypothetical protein